MLDVAHRFDHDTQVIDDLDEDLIMHVYVDGEWHRRTPDLHHTACALRVHLHRAPLRREVLEGALCSICFTDFERSEAKGPR